MDNTNRTVSILNITNETHLNSSSSGNSSLLLQDNNITAFGSLEVGINEKITIIKTAINFVIFPILTAFGLFGNLSTIIIYFQKKHKSASTYFIIGLAFSDLFYVLIRLVAQVYIICQTYFTETIRYVKPNSLFWLLFAQPIQKMGYLFVLVITLERVTAVWFPLHLRMIWTKGRSKLIAAVVVLLPLGEVVLVIDNLLFCINEHVPEQGPVSTFLEGVRYFGAQDRFVFIWSYVYRAIFEILPLPIVLILNIVIIIGVRRSGACLVTQGMNSTQQRRNVQEAQITKMLLTISVMFVILSGPYTILVTLTAVLDPSSVDMVVYEILHALTLLNNVINFIVYSGIDASFRKELFRVFQCQTKLSAGNSKITG